MSANDTEAVLEFEQGARFDAELTVSDAAGAAFDLTNYTKLTGQVRTEQSKTSALLTTIDVVRKNPPGADGVLALTVIPVKTGAITNPGHWDVFIEHTSDATLKFRVGHGTTTLEPQVTT